MLDLVSILKESHSREENYTQKQQEWLLSERTRIAKRIAIAYEDRLDWRITGDEYDKIVLDMKKKDRDILAQLTDHSKWDEAFLITTSYILELAHRAYMIFKNSQTGKKRELINFIFANFEADGWKLLYKTKEPLWEVLVCAKSWKWLPG